jgi:hypothetical protein
MLFCEEINGPETRTVAEVEVDDIPGAALEAYIEPATMISWAVVEFIPAAEPAYTEPVTVMFPVDVDDTPFVVVPIIEPL